ncbi:MAG: HEAT repeat domain-containing protein [Planctomycetes bacterium]|nr:HEAT repeat domain-containing protein [Planctomycetota bacterium]
MWESWWASGNREGILAFGDTPEERLARIQEAIANRQSITNDELDKVLAVLKKASENENWMLRLNAALKIGEVGYPRHRAMLDKLLVDESNFVRAAAHMAVGMLGDTDSFEALSRVIANPSEHIMVRGYALVGLGFMADFARKQEEDVSEIVAFIHRALDNPDVEVEIGVAALSACEILKDVSASELIRAQANHRSEQVSCHALSALGRVGYTPENLDFLKQCLTFDGMGISRRQSIAVALSCYSKIDDDAKLNGLVNLIVQRVDPENREREKDLFTREMHLVALARIAASNGNHRTIAHSVLSHFLTEGSIEERGFAALGLAIMYDVPGADEQKLNAVLGTLAQKLSGEGENSTSVRSASATALGLLSKRVSVETRGVVRAALRKCVADERERADVRHYAFYGLAFSYRDLGIDASDQSNPEAEQLTSDRRLMESVLANPRNRNNTDLIWNASIAFGLLYEDENLPDVFKNHLLNSDSSEVRSAVCLALGIGRNRRAIDHLVATYETERHYFVQIKIVSALGEIESKFGCSAFSVTARDHNYKVNGTQLSDLY